MLKTTRPVQHSVERPWWNDHFGRFSNHKRGAPEYVQPIREEDWMWFKGKQQ